MFKTVALVFVVLLGMQSTADCALYQWVDEKGGVHFSDQPPLTNRKVAAPPPADTSRARSFPLPRHGALVLTVPASWDQEVRQAPEGLPPTIVLTPREGDDFEVMITPFWSLKNEPGFNSATATKRLVGGDLVKLLPTAVERDVQLVEIPGKDGAGYYFLLTDKEPGSGYPHMARAGIGVGDLLLYVTVLCRSKDSEGLRQAILALQGAVHTKG